MSLDEESLLTCSRGLCGKLWHTRCSNTETPANHMSCTQRCPTHTHIEVWLVQVNDVNFCIHYSSKLLVNGNLNNLRMFHFILKFLSERIHLVDVLGSCPREAARVVTAEHVERRVVRVRPHRADHFHKHRVHVVLVPDAGLSCRSGNKSHEPCI